jgi:hypothetical protein
VAAAVLAEEVVAVAVVAVVTVVAVVALAAVVDEESGDDAVVSFL